MDIMAIPCLDFWKCSLVSSNPISVYLGFIGEKSLESQIGASANPLGLGVSECEGLGLIKEGLGWCNKPSRSCLLDECVYSFLLLRAGHILLIRGPAQGAYLHAWQALGVGIKRSHLLSKKPAPLNYSILSCNCLKSFNSF
eukprot:TRINITY_DN2866_c0_g1_i3.p1 TRINITY_DN2866_c0_g1~~TRINITY_DN2866_c0_g1_i3.p1  ORF type:complete len:141 (+),score=10.72 TRINITY_DN2866_c0_g1_i3:884-1306(+)